MKRRTGATRVWTCAAALFAIVGCGGETTASVSSPAPTGASLFTETPDVQIQLPQRLREISGLAVTPDGRLFAHGDERAALYEIDPERGRILKSFSLNVRGDFEGLA